MTKCKEAIAIHELSRKFFYLLFMIYAASLVIFAKADNEIVGNLAGVVLILFFILHQFFFRSQSYYLNSMLIIYFIFLLWCILSLVWTIDVNYSSYTIIRMVQIFVNLLLLYNILKIFKVHEAVFVGFVIGMFFNIFVALNIISPGYPIYLKMRYIGSTVHPNVMGAYAVFGILSAILLLQSVKNKVGISLILTSIFASFYIIILAESRASLVISIFIILLYLVQILLNAKTRIYLFIFLVIVFVLFIYFVDMQVLLEHVDKMTDRLAGMMGALDGHHADSSTQERLYFLHRMTEVFQHNPFIGTGVNTSRVFLYGFYSHNNYIEILGTLGLIGGLIYYSAYAHMIWKISHVGDFWTKYYLLVFAMVIIAFDFAAVTFYSKVTLMMLLVLHFVAEEKSQKNNPD